MDHLDRKQICGFNYAVHSKFQFVLFQSQFATMVKQLASEILETSSSSWTGGGREVSDLIHVCRTMHLAKALDSNSDDLVHLQLCAAVLLSFASSLPRDEDDALNSTLVDLSGRIQSDACDLIARAHFALRLGKDSADVSVLALQSLKDLLVVALHATLSTTQSNHANALHLKLVDSLLQTFRQSLILLGNNKKASFLSFA